MSTYNNNSSVSKTPVVIRATVGKQPRADGLAAMLELTFNRALDKKPKTIVKPAISSKPKVEDDVQAIKVMKTPRA
jgi:hypothetical protein